MTNEKTNDFIFEMKKHGWEEARKEDLENRFIKKTVQREYGTDDIFIETEEGDIYSWTNSFAYIDLSSAELKLLAEYKNFIEELEKFY